MNTPTPGVRVAALVSDPAQRSYLRRDGWWAELVVGEFGFVEDYGYKLAEVTFHFRGNGVRFAGPNGDLAFHYAPEDGGWFGAELRIGVPDDDPGMSLDGVLNRGQQQPRRRSDDHTEIAAVIRRWAAALRRQAPRVLTQSSLG